MPEPSGRLSRAAWLVVLAAGLALFEGLRHTLISTGNPNLIPALILLGAATVPAAFVTLVCGLRLAFDVPAIAIVVVAVIGGCVGVIIAGTVEYDTLHDLGVLPMVGVALIEETAKLVVPIAVLLLVRRYRRDADGLLIGVAVGAGFAVLETMGYAFVALANSKGDVSSVDGVLLLRGVLSPAGHMAWTGLAAAALWPAVLRPGPATVGRFAAAFGLAIALHTAWDSLGTVVAFSGLALLSLGSLTVVSTVLARTSRSSHRPNRARNLAVRRNAVPTR